MELVLDGIEVHAGSQVHLYPMSLAPVPGAMTVLLGATLAGKTTLMRVMAGLDRPSDGRVLADGQDVTGVPVRQRNVAMVYQQFINYPSLTVAQNIASPLRLRGARAAEIDTAVRAMAARLRIDHLLERLPAELSGGQQQRVALARALVKQAPLVLLDEPLVNLDYKLRESLRDELAGLFAEGQATVVYATTEPAEALLLGGHTAVLDAGELLQYGPTPEVFHRPVSLRVARAFSDPPMNLYAARRTPTGLSLPGGLEVARALPDAGSDAALTAGIRAGAFRVAARPGDVALAGSVALAEISGSDTFLHLATPAGPVVAQMPGVHRHALGAPLTLYFDPADTYAFDAAGWLVAAPLSLREGR
ncbi:ABC transporter [Bordetella genomosp. 1]|uniref:ABC transporter n=1 Tax=Bordetella genomosp. 1 TaxID=1395607 RepID=A0A261SHI7_9BORD|nr:ABC transporter ATP-binding protein [Bordetella genomosp. 1]OZI35823.1 ABC transporter [Bordetella genomosp. 1]